jgi:hypothetical protein
MKHHYKIILNDSSRILYIKILNQIILNDPSLSTVPNKKIYKHCVIRGKVPSYIEPY